MSTPRPRPTTTRGGALLALIALLLAGGALVLPAHAEEDPGLKQRIGADQKVAGGQVELGQGHVDIGPRYVEGSWRLMVHDDSSLDGPVWRELDDVVFRVGDNAAREVPADPAYEFLGVAAGTRVHVVPQTQNDDVVWIGWNTQDPGVLKNADRGVTLSLAGVQGPGAVTVYLQSGTFGEPDILWDSRRPERQDLWVDINTHTHANWVFTRPGVYLVRLVATADLVDGRTVTDTRTVRLVAGDRTTTAQAFATRSELPERPSSPDASSDASAGAGASGNHSDSGTGVLPVVGVSALAVVIAGALVALRNRRARERGYGSGESA